MGFLYYLENKMNVYQSDKVSENNLSIRADDQCWMTVEKIKRKEVSVPELKGCYKTKQTKYFRNIFYSS